jgi:hypothetical protein
LGFASCCKQEVFSASPKSFHVHQVESLVSFSPIIFPPTPLLTLVQGLSHGTSPHALLASLFDAPSILLGTVIDAPPLLPLLFCPLPPPFQKKVNRINTNFLTCSSSGAGVNTFAVMNKHRPPLRLHECRAFSLVSRSALRGRFEQRRIGGVAPRPRNL